MENTLKVIYYNNLYDLYGALLNEREKEIYALFYEEDLSLQEIAINRGVSKSAIGSAIKTINQKLEDYEQKLGFLKKKEDLLKEIAKINDFQVRNNFQKIIER